MDDSLLVAAVNGLTQLLEHLKDELLVEEIVFPVSRDPLEQVASLAVLHHNEQLLGVGDVDRVVDFHHMFIIDTGLNLNLHIKVV